MGDCHVAPVKGNTQIDHLWLSPELAAAFRGLEVVHDMFPDHVVLKATFDGAANQFIRYIWPTPQPVPWQHVPDLAQPVDFQHASPTEQYANLWNMRESSASDALKHAWQPNMQGRGQRTATTIRRGWPAPPKQGRSFDPQPTFMGYDVQHARWLRPAWSTTTNGPNATGSMHPLLLGLMDFCFGVAFWMPQVLDFRSQNGGWAEVVLG